MSPVAKLEGVRYFCGSGAGAQEHHPAPMTTIVLLTLSNVFMTFAWYGHLKFLHDKPLWVTVLISWGIAFFEYCLMVPANRLGYGKFTGYELKIIQEVITLVIFVGFAWAVLGEKLRWNYAVSLALIFLAVYFAFGFRPNPGA